ncbi:MAG: DUF115 domain-containing protein [Magnetococcales bacterium]|nr:DUF115 domain-containing protein [Magnetococcales bacterium]
MDSSQDPLGVVLTNEFGERYFPSIIGEAFSLSGSDSFYHRHYGESLAKEGHLYLIIGTDGGLLLNWLLKGKTATDSRYLFIEISSSLQRLYAEGLIPEELPDNISVQPYEQWFEQALEQSMRDYFYVSKLMAIKSLSVFDGYHESYVELGTLVESKFSLFHMQMVQEVGSGIFAQKGLENIAENRMPVSMLDDIFAGKTAVLMAGGPSLDESFEWIRANRENLVVLAVARIAPQLKREKIVPDFIFAIDPYGLIFHQCKEMLDFYKQTFLVNMYHLNTQLVGQWRGKNFYIGTLFPWATEKNPRFKLFPGITVAHYALGVALDMGFSKIVLAGIDLCFSKEGFTHAQGSAEAQVGPYTKRSQLWVETNGGWQAETSPDFHSSLNALNTIAGQGVEKSERKCQLINPSQASAKIENIDHLPWDSITTTPLTISAVDSINNLLAESSVPSWSDHYQMVEGELNLVRGKLLKIKKLAENAIVYNDKLFGRKGHPPDFKYKKMMDDVELSLNNDFGDISRLVKSWSVGKLLKLSRPNKDVEWTDEEIEETGRRYYEIYRDSVKELLKVLDDSRQRLRARIEETKPRPNIKTLITQWNRDGQPGRLYTFLDRSGRSIEDFPEKQAESLKEVAQSFADILAETETDYSVHCQNTLASPMAILSKAKHFFTTNDTAKLENFLDGIKESSLEEKDAFVNLMEGYVAQKAGNLELALDHYEKVNSKMLEGECLKQCLSVYLLQNDLARACLVAEKLSEESMLFTPYYADLLRLTGDQKLAVVKYREYLDVVDHDLVVKQKLGKLYGDMGSRVEAVEMFEEILKDDPQNMAVKHYIEQFSDNV